MSRHARWWLLFGALFAMTGAWAVATPRLTGPDEAEHALRAAATVRGQLLGDFVLGPFGYEMKVDVPSATCRAIPDPFLDCDGPAYTYQFRNPPPYYAVVGVPSLVSHGARGVFLMRLTSAAIASALLASALLSALQLGRSLAVVGVLAATTPVALSLAGQVNPNGVEVAAAIGLWSALAVLALRQTDEDASRVLLRRAGIALCVLCLSRGLAPAFGALAIVAAAALAGNDRARALLRRRDVRAWGIAAAVATAATATWVAVAGFSHNVPRTGTGLLDSVGATGRFLREVVGDVPDLGASLPVVVVVWAVIALALIVLAFVRGTTRQRVVLLGIVVAAISLPITTDGFNLPPLGYGWQGRYGLPVIAGALVVAGAIVAAGRRASIGVGALTVAHVAAFGLTHHGTRVTAPDTPVPFPVLLAVFAAGAACLAAMLLRPARLTSPS